jgi:hypothetical protein
LNAQPAPTHLLLLPITLHPDNRWTPQKPAYLSDFNPGAYNNQPCFFSPDEIYLSAQQPADTFQTDILSLHLNNHTRTTITQTPHSSEYSPNPIPRKARFSAVRVEPDGKQRLWSYPTDRSNSGKPEFPHILRVGYHAWINDTTAALYIVDDPNELVWVGTKSQKKYRISGNTGRCLQPLPGDKLAFVFKATPDTWQLLVWSHATKTTTHLADMPKGSEDFCILADGTILSGKGAKIMQYHPDRDIEWMELANLIPYGVQQVSRIATNNAGLLVVVTQ